MSLPVRFRMSKSDLQARPVYHRKRDSIEAHLTIVFAALAVGRWIEAQTGWSIRKFVKTARRYRTIEIQAGRQTIIAADPLPDDLRQASKPSTTTTDLRTRMTQLGYHGHPLGALVYESGRAHPGHGTLDQQPWTRKACG